MNQLDALVVTISKANKIEFLRVELKTELVKGWAKVVIDQLEFSDCTDYKSNVVSVDDYACIWASIGVKNVCDDWAHNTGPNSIAGGRALRISGELVDFKVSFVYKPKIDLHLEVVVDVLEFLDKIVTRKFRCKIKEGSISVAAAKCARDVEEYNHSNTIQWFDLCDVVVQWKVSSTDRTISDLGVLDGAC